MTSKTMTDLPSFQRQILSSSFGCLVTSTTMTPLDVIKTRLQIQSTAKTSLKLDNTACLNIADCLCIDANKTKLNTNSRFSRELFTKSCRYHFENGLDAGLKIIRNEGLSSLWSGMLPTLAIGSFSICFYFTLYEHLRDTSKTISYLPQTENYQNFIYTPASGVIARTLTCILVNPIEITKVRMQANSGGNSFVNEIRNLLSHSVDERSQIQNLLISK